MEKRFVKFYPGAYTEREKPFLKEFLDICRAIEDRGPVAPEDIRLGRVDENTPGVYTQVITDEEIRYNAGKYAPDEPMYNDEAYAVKLGYKSLPTTTASCAPSPTGPGTICWCPAWTMR